MNIHETDVPSSSLWELSSRIDSCEPIPRADPQGADPQGADSQGADSKGADSRETILKLNHLHLYLKVSGNQLTVLTQNSIRKAHFPCPVVGMSPTISGE